MSEPSPQVADDLFGALASHSRRRLLRHLQSREGPVALEEAARVIEPVGGDRRRVTSEYRSALYHVHAPKLADVGLIEFDRDREVLAATAETDRVGPLLQWAAEGTVEA